MPNNNTLGTVEKNYGTLDKLEKLIPVVDKVGNGITTGLVATAIAGTALGLPLYAITGLMSVGVTFTAIVLALMGVATITALSTGAITNKLNEKYAKLNDETAQKQLNAVIEGIHKSGSISLTEIPYVSTDDLSKNNDMPEWFNEVQNILNEKDM